MMRWSPAGVTGLRLSHDDAPSPGVTASLLRLRQRLVEKHPGGIVDSVLGYQTLTVFFDPAVITRDRLADTVESLGADRSDVPLSGRRIEVPVWYSEESGIDLAAVAEYCRVSVDDVVEMHSSEVYNAYATGFAPGFCYLGDTPEPLTIPRLDAPRREVPAGSVALADRQTAVYPSVSPGGWRLIGLCPLKLFDLGQSPPGLIAVGDQISFRPISRDRFLELGGIL